VVTGLERATSWSPPACRSSPRPEVRIATAGVRRKGIMRRLKLSEGAELHHVVRRLADADVHRGGMGAYTASAATRIALTIRTMTVSAKWPGATPRHAREGTDRLAKKLRRCRARHIKAHQTPARLQDLHNMRDARRPRWPTMWSKVRKKSGTSARDHARRGSRPNVNDESEIRSASSTA